MSNKHYHEIGFWVTATIAIGVVGFLWLNLPAIIHWYVPTLDANNTDQLHSLQERGLFGDSFGALNALFSGLAFAGLAIAIYLQRRELSETKEQLFKQSFETTFFKMLELHYSSLSQIRVGDFSGRNAISKLYRSYSGIRDGFSRRANVEPPAPFADVAEAAPVYEDFFNSNRDDLAHYFRYLFRIVKFVDQSSIRDKRFYTGTIRAQMSQDELRLLFYNGVSPIGLAFKELIEKYALLEHLPVSTLYHPDDFKLYERKAFGTQSLPE